MSRSSFGQPPSPQVGMQGPQTLGPKPMGAPMSAPKMAPQSGIAPPPGMPRGAPGGSNPAGPGVSASPSMFRRPRY